MDVIKSSGIPLPTFFLFLFLLLLSLTFPPTSSAANHLFLHNKTRRPPIPFHNLVSSTLLPVHGNVYPLGHFTVSLNIGNRPELYELDVDTGSDLTWVQCDAPCKRCTLPRDKLYKPHNNFVERGDPLCAAVSEPPGNHCTQPQDRCEYMVKYEDGVSSRGALVRDYIPLKSPDGTFLKPEVAFGCGYDQRSHGPHFAPLPAGVLGLGNGKISILSQLHSQGLISNVVGHCLSANGGGFLFFGDKYIHSPGIVWTPIIRQSSQEQHYNSGPADLLFNGRATSVKGLQLIFDSGTTYTYFNAKSYQVILDLVNNDLSGKPLSRTTDESLPICWKGAKPFKALSDVNRYFKPLALSFPKSGNSQFRLPPEAYLIISNHGNACLGILNGTQIGLENNIIGDISFQDKIVIYDNEKQRIGWGPADCDKPQKSLINIV